MENTTAYSSLTDLDVFYPERPFLILDPNSDYATNVLGQHTSLM